jgi:signal transduction histidine kinase
MHLRLGPETTDARRGEDTALDWKLGPVSVLARMLQTATKSARLAPARKASSSTALHQHMGKLSLTTRFLLFAILIMATAMLALGATITNAVRLGIAEGVARTAAAGFDSLVSSTLAPIVEREALTQEDRNRLSAFFEIGAEAQATRLVQVRIFRKTGELLFESSTDIVDDETGDRLARALGGEISSDVVELPVSPAGPFGSHSLSLLRLHTPLHARGSEQIIGSAVLYYSARSLLDIEAETQSVVWRMVYIIGAAVTGLLFVFVSTADRTITRQGKTLSDNLEQSRLLSEEVQRLHIKSEQLRIDAIEANEQLLARVGSDIHDGPLQLMALSILQLSRAVEEKGKIDGETLRPTVALTSDAMTELRNISVGLVLPELDGLTLAQTLELAIGRHEGATGMLVNRGIAGLDQAIETDVQVCLYRIIQECLTNAARHSDGRDLSVTAYHATHHLVVEVANSVGHTRQVAPELRPRLGLRGMRLRLNAVGGSLDVKLDDARVIVRAVVPRPNQSEVAAQ